MRDRDDVEGVLTEVRAQSWHPWVADILNSLWTSRSSPRCPLTHCSGAWQRRVDSASWKMAPPCVWTLLWSLPSPVLPWDPSPLPPRALPGVQLGGEGAQADRSNTARLCSQPDHCEHDTRAVDLNPPGAAGRLGKRWAGMLQQWQLGSCAR